MIKSAGNRISPTEIEEAVDRGRRGGRGGRAGRARRAAGAGDPAWCARGDGAMRRTLRARLRRDLPSFQQPRAIVWRDALPRNANGKLDRARVRAGADA